MEVLDISRVLGRLREIREVADIYEYSSFPYYKYPGVQYGKKIQMYMFLSATMSNYMTMHEYFMYDYR